MSNILKGLTEHTILEVNKSLGLRVGDMIADIAIAQPTTGPIKDSIDNGLLFTLELDGTIKLAEVATTKALFIHYTEELMTNTYGTSLKYFTVYYDEDKKAYPRLIRLHVGDVFTVDTYEFTGDLKTVKFATISGTGGFKGLTAAPIAGHVFAAKPSTNPNGSKKALELTYVGLAA